MLRAPAATGCALVIRVDGCLNWLASSVQAPSLGCAEAAALLGRIGQLAEGVGELDAAGIELEPLGHPRVARLRPRQGRFELSLQSPFGIEIAVERFPFADEDDVVRSHPLAGTTPRTGDPATDDELARKLLASIKDQIEHRVVIDVMPKPEILDPQGRAVQGALGRLGLDGVTDVRQGKQFVIDVDGPVEGETLELMHRLAGELLSNPVIEDYTLQVRD